MAEPPAANRGPTDGGEAAAPQVVFRVLDCLGQEDTFSPGEMCFPVQVCLRYPERLQMWEKDVTLACTAA